LAEPLTDTSTTAQPSSSASSDRPPLLEMVGISKRFGGVRALQGVSFSVSAGEVVALIGENGAGKSTLMKTIGGVHQPDTGEIRVNGRPVVLRSAGDAIKLGIGFIHQELNVVDNLDIAGNVFLGREPLKGGPLRVLDRARMIRETQPFLDRLGLGLAADMPLDSLSLAQRQMVEIAKTLSQNARLLIMDEPTSSLTLAETDRLLRLVCDLRDHGVGVIYISHRLDEVVQIADRVVGLRDGKNAGGLAREEISHARMIRLMVGRDIERVERPVREGDGDRPVVLSVRGLRTPRYPEREVALDLRGGEILGLAGLVGAGRSEVAQALFGVEPALSGSVTFEGHPVVLQSPRDAIRAGIYLVPEDRRHAGLILEMTIRENITLPALGRYATSGLIRSDAERGAADEAARVLAVKAPTVEFAAGNLSGGNQQKVVLAKWLSLGPKVMIFDEPTRGVDVGAKAEIYARMRELAQRGVAVLMISSDMEEVIGQSDRIAVMHEGRVTGTLTRDAFSEEAIMNLAVGGIY